MHLPLKTFFALCACCLWAVAGHAAGTDDKATSPGPSVKVLKDYAVIELAEKQFDFGEVLEGTKITHDFVVSNKGTIPLEIKNINVGCDCITTQFNTSIAPGQEGKITVNINTMNYPGGFARFINIASNDGMRPHVRVSLRGRVKPLMDIQPGDLVALDGVVGLMEAKSIELKATDKPIRITKVENGLPDKVSCELETVEEGRHYRLKVRNIGPSGRYQGTIKLLTDSPEKPHISVHVQGKIDGLVTIMPLRALIGKTSANSEPRIATVQVVSNVPNKSFEITKLSYDEKLMTVDLQPLPNSPGYQLTIKPNIENMPQTKGRKQRAETIVNVHTNLQTEPFPVKVAYANESEQ